MMAIQVQVCTIYYFLPSFKLPVGRQYVCWAVLCPCLYRMDRNTKAKVKRSWRRMGGAAVKLEEHGCHTGAIVLWPDGSIKVGCYSFPQFEATNCTKMKKEHF